MGCQPAITAEVKATTGTPEEKKQEKVKEEPKIVENKEENATSSTKEEKTIVKEENGVITTEKTTTVVVESSEGQEVTIVETIVIIETDEEDKKFSIGSVKEEKYRAIPINSMTEDSIPVDNLVIFEIGNLGGIRAKGKNYQIAGRLLIDGHVYMKKQYADERIVKYHGKMNGIRCIGTFQAKDCVTHNFEIEFKLLPYESGSSMIAPFSPFPKDDERMFGFTYDGEAVVPGKTEPGAWGVFALEPKKQGENVRTGKTYFVDGKEVESTLEADENSFQFTVKDTPRFYIKTY
jgi:hypothetical protein